MSGNVLTAFDNDNEGKLFALANVIVRKRSEDVEINILHVLNTKKVAWRFRAYLDVVKQPLPQRLIDSFPGKNKDEIWDIKVAWWRKIIAPNTHSITCTYQDTRPQRIQLIHLRKKMELLSKQI